MESFVVFSPILKSLSLDKLPLTDQPFRTARSSSSMSGLILGEKRLSLNERSWLKTDEIQFLLAFLTRNEENPFLISDPFQGGNVESVNMRMMIPMMPLMIPMMPLTTFVGGVFSTP